MHTNKGIWLLSGCLVLPALWLIATTPVDDLRTVMLLCGAVVTAVGMVALAWRAHRSGVLLPNRCANCERPMCYTRPGEVTPPAGSAVTQTRFWRCRYCGRLV